MSSSTGKHRLLLPLALFAVAAPTAGCRDTARAAGTAIFVSVAFDAENLPLTQLRFSATSDGQSLFEPVLRPDTAAAGSLPSGQTLRIRLPDSLSGQLVTVGAEGMNGGRVVSLAHADVHVRRDFEIEVDLVLAASSEPACGPCMGCCSGMVCITAYSPLNWRQRSSLYAVRSIERGQLRHRRVPLRLGAGLQQGGGPVRRA